MLRPDRRRRGPDPTLQLRMAMFVLGAVAGLTGMALDQLWLVTVGTIFLAIGLVIAMIEHRKRERAHRDAEE